MGIQWKCNWLTTLLYTYNLKSSVAITRQPSEKGSVFNDFHCECWALSEYTEKVSPLESCECLTPCHKERAENSILGYSIKRVYKGQEGKKRGHEDKSL